MFKPIIACNICIVGIIFCIVSCFGFEALGSGQSGYCMITNYTGITTNHTFFVSIAASLCNIYIKI